MAERRACPECRREIAVVGGRVARHDAPGTRAAGGLESCRGSRRYVGASAGQDALDGFVVPDFPGQMPLW
ncbi:MULTISPECIES: hypothetical protein [unclassified Streptomyces]|uniref:Uncharacterized protein n=1 Tax=Streptomyces evansiae TaxID=3075535 RepID=A0ABD5E4V5_9ACTN|nr:MULTISPECIES: hypothetical protein [unclassified Streptomyces]MDT0415320.1 hypothetical protein [Streptomyces sp. DSM 41982]WEH29241.1 hypothetical protein P0D76_19015 [Streptomyces sp. AM 3-1-1]